MWLKLFYFVTNLLHMLRNQAKAYIFIILAMIIWGFSFVWSKSLLRVLSPMALVSTRYLLAAFFSVFFLMLRKKNFKVNRKHFPLFILLALLEPVLYSICEIYGIELTSSGIAAIIISTIPITIAIANFFYLKEKLTPLNLFGIIISFAGIGIILIDKSFGLYASYAGVLFLTGSVVAATISGFILKKLTTHYTVPTIISYQNIISAILFSPFFIFCSPQIIVVRFNFENIFSLLSLAIFASIVAFSLYTYGITKIGLTKTTVFTNLIPIFTVIIAYFYFKEIVTIQKALGMLVVITGLFLSQRQRKGEFIPPPLS